MRPIARTELPEQPTGVRLDRVLRDEQLASDLGANERLAELLIAAANRASQPRLAVDLLRQAGISKIAFAITPVAKAGDAPTDKAQ